ncbi:hypothetical protein DESPIGER_1578 [Desulfovibrio piger]|uniref:Uncharacterized protein n=1 Tax=Desulfovibrio piger TaxID=901 RepID=A0A1K1LFC5_9BACT|nr:hypothetical protein DESPIGER_1578 [Desulfovibrio piger]
MPGQSTISACPVKSREDTPAGQRRERPPRARSPARAGASATGKAGPAPCEGPAPASSGLRRMPGVHA